MGSSVFSPRGSGAMRVVFSPVLPKQIHAWSSFQNFVAQWVHCLGRWKKKGWRAGGLWEPWGPWGCPGTLTAAEGNLFPNPKGPLKLVTLYLSLLLLFSRSVVSDSLWPHGLQHAKLPCPSPSPRVCSSSCLLSGWCHPTISFSVIPFSFCLQSFPSSGSFLMSWLFTSGGQSIAAVSHQIKEQAKFLKTGLST